MCLPSHTSYFLQPLDRSIFKALKSSYFTIVHNWLKQNPSKKLNRLPFPKICNTAWNNAAIRQNGVSGFSATGLFPFNRDAIPEYAFLNPFTGCNPGQSGSQFVEDSTEIQQQPRCEDHAVNKNQNKTSKKKGNLKKTKNINNRHINKIKKN